jgi:hypothetical protein
MRRYYHDLINYLEVSNDLAGAIAAARESIEVTGFGHARLASLYKRTGDHASYESERAALASPGADPDDFQEFLSRERLSNRGADGSTKRPHVAPETTKHFGLAGH